MRKTTKQRILFWAIAVIFTLVLASYQRLSGPTYPISGEIKFNNKTIPYKLERSRSSEEDYTISIKTDDPSIKGYLYWRRYKTEDTLTIDKMLFDGVEHHVNLPKQPPAGKLEYYIKLTKDSSAAAFIPPDEHVVIRFKGDVPAIILLLHILAMFGAMVLSTRTGLEFFAKKPDVHKLTLWTIGALILGGFILGPIMQWFAFGALWTGFPLGYDLTDTKTLAALAGWLIAYFRYEKTRRPEKLAMYAAIVMIIVYLIPHSVLGSELDYSNLEKENVIIEQAAE